MQRQTLALRQDNDGPDDEDLIARIAGGDGPAFRVFTDRYTRLVYALAYRMQFSHAAAEDTVQETFLRVWKNAGSWKANGGASVKTWLCRIASNACIDALRKTGKQGSGDMPEPVDQSPDAQKAMEAQQTGAIVGRAMQTLPDRQRAALVLFHYEGLSMAEVAASLGTSVKGAEGLLGRARTTLRKKLEKYEGVL